MGRPHQINPHRKSLTRQAAVRLIFSLGLFVMLVGLSSGMLYQAALTKAARERTDDLASFYSSRLSQLEREWELQSLDFKVRIEYTRILEQSKTSAGEDLQAFMTIQGANRRFQYLMIEDNKGKLVFASGSRLSLRQIPPLTGSGGWYIDPSTGNLFRVFDEQIWLGNEGMGRLAIFFSVDHALLNQMATPQVTLTALYQGRAVASSLGEAGLGDPAQLETGSPERRRLAWNGTTHGPELLIRAPVKGLFSVTELALGASIIPVFDGLILWFTLGTWLMRHTRRVKSLGNAVSGFALARTMTTPLRQEILDAKSTQLDEIHEVATAVESMAEQEMRREQERAVEEAQQRLWSQVFHSSGEAILICDRAVRIIAANETFERLTGYSQEEVLGKNPHVLSSGRESSEFYREMWGRLDECGFWQGEIWDRRKDGSQYPKWLSISVTYDERGEPANYIGSFTDMTERMAEKEYIQFIAHHDALTALPNRLMLHDFLGRAVYGAKRDNGQVGILFMDLDHFKNINDSLGHDMGDKLLIEVAHRLTEIVRGNDSVARIGGDEFVVVVSKIGQTLELAHLATRIVEQLSLPYLIDQIKLHTSPSIGISLYPADGEDIPTLLKHADAAMYHAKSEGRGNFQFYMPAMNQVAQDRLDLENQLRTALERDEFELYYQPQVEVASGEVVGVEALARWLSPARGLVSPAIFIPVAEETGLIIALGEWALQTACRQAMDWRREGLPAIRMAVNISARQFKQEGLLETVRIALDSSGLEPCRLELEITESVAMASPENTVRTLKAFKSMGVQLAIDDFGTGYSSLAYLKLFPIDKLKIDQSFVRDIEKDADDATIAAATIALAGKLGLKVIAEGVETVGQLRFIAENGCDEAQGYYFARPLPAAEMNEYLRAAVKTNPAN